MQIQGREKILGISVLSCVGIFIIFMLVQGAILKPAQELKRQKNIRTHIFLVPGEGRL